MTTRHTNESPDGQIRLFLRGSSTASREHGALKPSVLLDPELDACRAKIHATRPTCAGMKTMMHSEQRCSHDTDRLLLLQTRTYNNLSKSWRQLCCGYSHMRRNEFHVARPTEGTGAEHKAAATSVGSNGNAASIKFFCLKFGRPVRTPFGGNVLPKHSNPSACELFPRPGLHPHSCVQQRSRLSLGCRTAGGLAAAPCARPRARAHTSKCDGLTHEPEDVGLRTSPEITRLR